ncbi:ATP synthase subunit I [Moraxella marmotae]|uniref:ATP synthase subunit I n=1 Tax=Moraxella marmotae TaxID=3344520 RepID=UPI0035F2961D
MSSPAKKSQQATIYRNQNRQIWTVLALAVLGFGLSYALSDTNWLIAKGILAGSLLAFLGQVAFTYIAYHTVGVRYAKQIMLNTYLGLAIKWLISIAGFAFIFINLTPIHTFAVIAGYVLMQFFQSLSLMRLK